MGLRAKLGFALFVATCVVYLLSGVTIAVRNNQRLRTNLVARGEALLSAMSAPVGHTIALGHFELLDSYVGAMIHPSRARDLGLVYLFVLDPAGVVISHSEPARCGSAVTDPFLREALTSPSSLSRHTRTQDGREVIEVTAPAVSGFRRATVVAGLSTRPLSVAQTINTLEIAGVALLLAVASWIALYLLFARVVVGRLQPLLAATAAIGRGDLERRVEVVGHDEIAQLGASINRMAERITSHTHDLETRVQARTNDLIAANLDQKRLNEDLRDAVRRLERLATTDGLTGLSNHRHFHETLHAELQRAERSYASFAVIIIDVDLFKEYNDRHGHLAGDELLRNLGALFKRILRAVDHIARYGGEEFGVILPDTDSAGALVVAEKLRKTVADATHREGDQRHPGPLTISLGVACYPEHAQQANAIIEAADKALYRAKHAGRNRSVVASSETRVATPREVIR